MAFVPPETIVSGSALIIPDATRYHFGILTSNVHNAWMRAVPGRLETRYQYSSTIKYNTFPWPDASDSQQAEIAELAQNILNAITKFPTSTLADLYSPSGMQPELIKAHKNLDKAVMKLYEFHKDTPELAIVASLAKKYDELIEK
jgi:hypothetical protein